MRGRLGSPRTPMIAFSSVIVTCLARSTAWATCCWCCGKTYKRWLGHASIYNTPTLTYLWISHLIFLVLLQFNKWGQVPHTVNVATMGDFIFVLNCDTMSEPHSELTSCDRKGIIWAKIALSRLAISVWKNKRGAKWDGKVWNTQWLHITPPLMFTPIKSITAAIRTAWLNIL